MDRDLPEAELSQGQPAQHPVPPSRGLGVSFLLLSPLLVAAAFVFVFAVSDVTLPRLWHRFHAGGTGMWALALALAVGIAMQQVLALVALLRSRVLVWPLLIVPAFTCLAGLWFERAGVQRAFDAVAGFALAAPVRTAIFAEGTGEAQNPRALGFAGAGLLLTLAALNMAAYALQHAASVKWSKMSARALGAGGVGMCACVAFGLAGLAPSPLAVLVVAIGIAFAALCCALLGSTLETESAASDASRSSLLTMAAFAVAAQLCFAGFWETLAQSIAFGAIGGEAVPDEEAGSTLLQALRVAAWCKCWLLWLAVLPAALTWFTLRPGLAQKHLWQWSRTWPGLAALSLGGAALLVAQRATHAQVEQARVWQSEGVPLDHQFVFATGGRPMRFRSGPRPVLWVGKDSMRLDPESKVNAPLPETAQLLQPGCALEFGLDPASPAPYLVVDASLRAQHLSCLLAALWGLKPGGDNERNYRREFQHLHNFWILRAEQPALPPPYADLALRVVELDMQLTTRVSLQHLELYPTHWKLQIERTSLGLGGDISERRSHLIELLKGQQRVVSVAAAADIPAGEVLNAALAIVEAECEPQLWLSGYSGSADSNGY